MGMKERAAARRSKMVAYRATSFEEAEAWDLDFWQSRSPEERLSALGGDPEGCRKSPARAEIQEKGCIQGD